MKPKGTFNHCQICGHIPKDQYDELNLDCVKYWEPDDGWRIGTLCVDCFDEFGSIQPKPTDLAYQRRNEIADSNVNTESDPIDAL